MSATTSPPELIVRPVRTADHARVAELTLAAYDATGHPPSDDYRPILADVADRVARGAHVLVAQLDDRVVGSVAVTTHQEEFFEYAYPEHGDSGFRMLAVDPTIQGSGAGAALVGAAEELARDAGCQRMTITSMVWMTRAHGMYERRGFERIPELDRYFGTGLGLTFSKPLVPDAPIVRAWVRGPAVGRPRAEVEAGEEHGAQADRGVAGRG